jgi:hypothetical protein
MKTDRDISAAIMQIRIAAGGSADTCPTCLCPRERPYRHTRYQTGEIDEGCIDASHTEDMIDRPLGDPDSRWHGRPEAQQLRVDGLRRLLRMESDLRAWEASR